MNEPALSMTGELADQLARFDTRTVALRHSHLKAIGKSPAHCRFAMEHSDDSSLSQRIGSGVHSLILGGPPVLLYPGKQRRGKDYDVWRARHPSDALVYTQKQYDRTQRIAESIRNNTHAAQVLFAPGGVYETTIKWEWLGRKRRTTPDARTLSHLAEVKTTRDASPDRFKWDVLRYGYHAQLADQANAMQAESGVRPKDVYICAVETNPPFVCAVYRLTPNDLDFGERLNRLWMEKFLACEAINTWPGYCQSIQDLDLPDPSVDELGLTFADDADNDNQTGEDE